MRRRRPTSEVSAPESAASRPTERSITMSATAVDGPATERFSRAIASRSGFVSSSSSPSHSFTRLQSTSRPATSPVPSATGRYAIRIERRTCGWICGCTERTLPGSPAIVTRGDAEAPVASRTAVVTFRSRRQLRAERGRIPTDGPLSRRSARARTGLELLLQGPPKAAPRVQRRLQSSRARPGSRADTAIAGSRVPLPEPRTTVAVRSLRACEALPRVQPTGEIARPALRARPARLAHQASATAAASDATRRSQGSGVRAQPACDHVSPRCTSRVLNEPVGRRAALFRHSALRPEISSDQIGSQPGIQSPYRVSPGFPPSRE